MHTVVKLGLDFIPLGIARELFEYFKLYHSESLIHGLRALLRALKLQLTDVG